MIDWQQAATHVATLGIGSDDRLLLALFPPKDRKGKAGCTYIEVSPGSRWEPEQVERQLASHPGFSLGFIQNPGGTKDREIAWCRSLFFEDDSDESTMEEKVAQWESAGLPRPSLQVWTGGKSVHHYWLLEGPCTPTEFRRAQKRLFRHVQQALPQADIDMALCNPARILRLAGGVHPTTGQMSRVVSAGGQRYSFEQLWNLTGSDSLPSAETLEAVRQFNAPRVKAPKVTSEVAGEGPTGELQPLPEWDSNEHKLFRQLQVENDSIHKPEAGSFRDYARTRAMELVVSALPYCVDRGPGGSGTYPTAFKILAAMVNTYGVNDALQCAFSAAWGQKNWDITAEAQKIEENSDDRDSVCRVTIFHLFDSAEFNGWVRPWKITKSKAFDAEDEEEAAENRQIRRLHLAKWIEARASNFRLSDVLHPAIAALLNERAEAFPVSEVAMLPPFLAAAASIMGVRYRVRVKGGWEEPMVFWIGAVGPASTLKTPVAQQCLKPLLDRDYRDQKDYARLLNNWKAIPKEERGEQKPPAPPRKRVAGDATLEGLCAALDTGQNPGMVSYHDELVTFIASMDAYRGRGGQSKDRGHWLSMWSGQEINILRKGHDPIFIPRTCVNLFGCVQQDKLTELLQGDDASAKSGDGFWARFLWCVPCNPFPKMNRNETDITEQLRQVYTTLDNIAGKLTVTLDPEAWEVFAEQADRWSTEADETDPARAAFLGKMRGYSVRFAGFLHALDHAMNNLVPPPKESDEPKETGVMNSISPLISAEVMRRALVLSQFFINQFDVLAPQVGGNSDLPSWVVKVVELAQSREDKRVTAVDLRTKKWGENQRDRKRMLEELVSKYGIGRLVEAPRANQTWWELT